MAVFAAGPLVNLGDAFKAALFPFPHEWTVGRIREVYVFTRGVLGDNSVAHGTTLSIAYDILRCGLCVGLVGIQRMAGRCVVIFAWAEALHGIASRMPEAA